MKRPIDATTLRAEFTGNFNGGYYTVAEIKAIIDTAPTLDKDTNVPGKWISVEDRLPPEAGEYIVAYYPCHWESIQIQEPISVGMDSFRGKTKWAKEKYQRVTHWMEKPEPPEEEDHETN